VTRRRLESGHARLSVSVCLSLDEYAHYCTDPDVTWRNDGVPPSCALLDGFAIGVRVASLWQHNVCLRYKLPAPRAYDNIARTQNVSEYILVLALCL